MKKTQKRQPLDLSKSKPLEAKSSSRGVRSISVVNTAGNGKRVKLSNGLMDSLGNPSEVQFRILEGKIIIGCNLDENEKTFKFSKSAKGTLYNASVVQAFTDELELDYTNGTTSITLTNIRIKSAISVNGEKVKVAVVRAN